jgi:hypothetical protein
MLIEPPMFSRSSARAAPAARRSAAAARLVANCPIEKHLQDIFLGERPTSTS